MKLTLTEPRAYIIQLIAGGGVSTIPEIVDALKGFVTKRGNSFDYRRVWCLLRPKERDGLKYHAGYCAYVKKRNSFIAKCKGAGIKNKEIAEVLRIDIRLVRNINPEALE